MMDFANLLNSGLTALFIAMGYTLLKVIQYFISKNKTEEHEEKNHLTKEQDQTLKEINENLKELMTRSEQVCGMHEVYDENHVPKWYVPSELLTTSRRLKEETHRISQLIGEVKGSQAVLVDKLSDLINSQRLMTERLGDLISLIAKLKNLSD